MSKTEQSLSESPQNRLDATAEAEKSAADTPVVVFAAYKKIATHPRISRLCAEVRALGWRAVTIGLGRENARNVANDGTVTVTLRKPGVEASTASLFGLPARIGLKLIRLLARAAPSDFNQDASLVRSPQSTGSKRLSQPDNFLARAYQGLLRLERASARVGVELIQGPLARPLGALSILLFARNAARLCETEGVSILVAHDTYALAIARAATKIRTDLVWGYDLVETLYGRMPTRPPSIVSRAVLRNLERTARKANFIWSADTALSDALSARLDLHDLVEVLNYPEASGKADGISLAIRAGWPEKMSVAVYAGLINPNRNLDVLVDAAEHLPDGFGIVILGPATAGAGEAMSARIEASPAASRIKLLGPVAPDQLVSALATAQVGVSPMVARPGSNVQNIMTNKVFQYLAADLPQLASEGSRVAEFITQHQIGQAFAPHDPVQLAEAIVALAVPDEEAAKRRAELRKRMNWTKQAERVRESLLQALQKK